MFLFVFALAVGLYMHASVVASPEQMPGPLGLLAVFTLPKLAVLLVYLIACKITLNRLGKANGFKWLRYLRMLEAACRIALLASYSADLRYGVLEAVRGVIGDVVLIDELAVMLPPLLTMVGLWAVYYPIDRRMRQAALIATLDRAEPVSPVWTRGQFLVSQVRHQIAFVFVPLCAILAIDESLNFLGQRWSVDGSLPRLYGIDVISVLQLVCVGVVFVFAPVIIRHVWDTVPLPAGSLRDRLASMCKMHRVGYRKLLLWRTFGGMSNAAVMGIFKPLRYILLTDALLENMSESQVEAVMAHEIAHVRKHHIFWLLGAAFASISLLQIAADFASPLLHQVTTALGFAASPAPEAHEMPPQDYLLAVLVLVGWYVIFGWVSRRFERQADTFAVQHLSRRLESEAAEAMPPAQVGHVSPIAAGIMVDALQRIAVLNHIPTGGRSWRHGPIAWRQDYLRSLPGKPLDELPIDLTVSLIKLATLVAVIGTFAYYAISPSML